MEDMVNAAPIHGGKINLLFASVWPFGLEHGSKEWVSQDSRHCECMPAITKPRVTVSFK